MLFSDIEGSTSMVRQLGPRWGEALSAQRALLRAAFAANDGHEMGTEGDSFFVVFARAQQAVSAAVEGQRRLQECAWPGDRPLRVRMGLHTGEPTRHEDGYIGLDVHRAARIAATAAGGQIVMSAATRALVDTQLPGVTLRELGHHRLKDLPQPEQLFDVVAAGLGSAFPPLRSLGVAASLPTYSTELLGREADVAALVVMLEAGARLVTLTGPGGAGKTRLAVAAAARLHSEVDGDLFFVDAHAANRTALLWAKVAEVVGAPSEVNVLPRDRALGFLRGRTALVVLDNLEQIPDAEVAVGELLDAAPGVRVVATSRRPLHLVDEQLYPVAPLDLPPHGPEFDHDLTTVSRSSAARLFVQRARMVSPRFELGPTNVADVAQLCRRLDGLPLAIELAAARSRLLTPRAMLRRLGAEVGQSPVSDRSTESAERNRAQRQRTLSATIAWSYDLLDAADQRVFRQLGAFPSQVDLTAVATVVAGDTTDQPIDDPLDTVAHLVDVSLLEVGEGPDGEPTVAMLQTVRRFACEQLELSGESDEVRMRHARWCTAVAVEVEASLRGPNQMRARDRIAAVEQDMRAALDWCLVAPPAGTPERREQGYALLNAMTRYWYRFGYAAEGRGWHSRALRLLDEGADPTETVTDALHGAGVLLVQQNDLSAGEQALRRALETARRLGDADREARECNSLGIARREAGDTAGARRLIERSIELARQTGNRQREATGLTNLVHLHMDVGDYPAAVEAGRRAVAADEALGDPWGLAIVRCNLAFALLCAEGPEPAYRQLAECAAEAVALEDMELSIDVVESFAGIWAAMGDGERAARLVGSADAQREQAGMPRALPDEQLLQRFLAPARDTTEPTLWARAHQEGRDLDIDAALAVGLAGREHATVRRE